MKEEEERTKKKRVSNYCAIKHKNVQHHKFDILLFLPVWLSECNGMKEITMRGKMKSKVVIE